MPTSGAPNTTTPTVSVAAVHAWRLQRQFVDPPTDQDAAAVAARLCGVQAQVASAAATAIAVRQRTRHGSGTNVHRALASGYLLKIWAMRGTLHLLPGPTAADVLALISSGRRWEQPAWLRSVGLTADDVRALTTLVDEELEGQALPRDELVRRITTHARFRGREHQLLSGWGTLFKPLAWQGGICHAPPTDGAEGASAEAEDGSPGNNSGNGGSGSRAGSSAAGGHGGAGTSRAAGRGRTVFARPADVAPEWNGLPPVEEAAPRVISAYLGAYGPATPEVFDAWLTRSGLRKSVVRGWFESMGDALTRVRVEGRQGSSAAYVRSDHVDELVATEPTAAVQLLGAFDQYMLGPGTGDAELLPTEHRAEVSRKAGWISPLVVSGGRIVGTWKRDGTVLTVSLFPGTPRSLRPRKDALQAAAGRVATATGAERLTVRLGS